MILEKVNFLCYTIPVGLGLLCRTECDNQAHITFNISMVLKSQKRQKYVICNVYPYVSGELKPSECYPKHD